MTCLIPKSLNLVELFIPQLERMTVQWTGSHAIWGAFYPNIACGCRGHTQGLFVGSPGGTRVANVELNVKARIPKVRREGAPWSWSGEVLALDPHCLRLLE